jgi:hypothetical protein
VVYFEPEMNKYKYINTYMMFKMRNHGLEYGLAWLNLRDNTEIQAVKSYKKYLELRKPK